MKSRENKIGLSVLLIGLFLVLLFPILLTSYSLVDFTSTGNIGDTIGGITAPITGFVGAILVYLALRAQIKANETINSQLKSQQLEFQEQQKEKIKVELYSSIQFELKKLDEDIDSFKYVRKLNLDNKRDTSNVSGAVAIELFLEEFILFSKRFCNLYKSKKINLAAEYPSLTVIYLFLKRIKILAERIQVSNLSKDNKEHLLKLLVYTYDQKISPPLIKFSSETTAFDGVCNNCKKKHIGIPEGLMDLLDTLDLKCIRSIKKELEGDFKRVELYYNGKVD